jgi:hypothetical protein
MKLSWQSLIFRSSEMLILSRGMLTILVIIDFLVAMKFGFCDILFLGRKNGDINRSIFLREMESRSASGISRYLPM